MAIEFQSGVSRELAESEEGKRGQSTFFVYALPVRPPARARAGNRTQTGRRLLARLATILTWTFLTGLRTGLFNTL